MRSKNNNNRLAVIRDSGARNKKGEILWDCHCECGNDTQATTTQLNSGGKRSCGCLKVEAGRWAGKTYGGVARSKKLPKEKIKQHMAMMRSKKRDR